MQRLALHPLHSRGLCQRNRDPARSGLNGQRRFKRVGRLVHLARIQRCTPCILQRRRPRVQHLDRAEWLLLAATARASEGDRDGSKAHDYFLAETGETAEYLGGLEHDAIATKGLRLQQAGAQQRSRRCHHGRAKAGSFAALLTCAQIDGHGRHIVWRFRKAAN
jgi:hypothetical protein